jgi:hypothetical protein
MKSDGATRVTSSSLCARAADARKRESIARIG